MSSFHKLYEKNNYKRCFDFNLTKEMYLTLRSKNLFFSKILKVISLAQLLVHKMLVSIMKTDQVIRPLGPTPEQSERHQYYDSFNENAEIASNNVSFSTKDEMMMHDN